MQRTAAWAAATSADLEEGLSLQRPSPAPQASAAPSSPSDTSAAPPPGSAAGAADAAAANHLSRLLPDFSVGEGGGQEQPLQLWRGGRQQPGASAALTEVVGVTGGGNTASGNATRCTTTWSSLPLFCFAEVLSWMEDDCDRRRLRLVCRDWRAAAAAATTHLAPPRSGARHLGALAAAFPGLTALDLSACLAVGRPGRGTELRERVEGKGSCPRAALRGVVGRWSAAPRLLVTLRLRLHWPPPPPPSVRST